MKTVDEWKSDLRTRLRVALVARDTSEVSVLRVALAAIENAEAPPIQSAPASEDGVFAGSVSGLGRAEVPRLLLAPEAVLAIVEHEILERRAAAAEYVRLGRHEEARVLSSQADVLAALAAEATG